MFLRNTSLLGKISGGLNKKTFQKNPQNHNLKVFTSEAKTKQVISFFALLLLFTVCMS